MIPLHRRLEPRSFSMALCRVVMELLSLDVTCLTGNGWISAFLIIYDDQFDTTTFVSAFIFVNMVLSGSHEVDVVRCFIPFAERGPLAPIGTIPTNHVDGSTTGRRDHSGSFSGFRIHTYTNKQVSTSLPRSLSKDWRGLLLKGADCDTTPCPTDLRVVWK